MALSSWHMWIINKPHSANLHAFPGKHTVTVQNRVGPILPHYTVFIGPLSAHTCIETMVQTSQSKYEKLQILYTKPWVLMTQKYQSKWYWYQDSGLRHCSHTVRQWKDLGLRFNKPPLKISKPRSRRIRVWTLPIVLKFDKHLGSSAAEVPVKFQIYRIILNTNLATSSLHETLR